MLTSHAAISSGVATRPRFGPSAATATAEIRASAETVMRRLLRVDMFHLPFIGNAPGCDRVGVEDRPGPALGDHLLARRLDVPGVIDRAALQDGRATVPAPRHAETRQRFRQHWLLQRGRRPALAAVGRYLDLVDLAVA